MEWLDIVSKRHYEYVKIVRSFPENSNNKNIEDIVQDSYIELTEIGSKKHKPGDKRVNEKYKDLPICDRILDENNEVNMAYMWITLKRVSLKHLSLRRKNSEYLVRLGEGFDKSDSDDKEDEAAFDNLIKIIEEEMLKWHWYDRMLFDTYIYNEKSMRKLSKETTISVTSIFITLKNCKKRLRETCFEDYVDYLNKDYELIKQDNGESEKESN